MITHEGETKKLQWPSTNSQSSPDIALLKKMVAERFGLSARPETINFRVTSYSASLTTDE